MKVIIHSGQGRGIRIMLPTRLVLNYFSAAVITPVVNRLTGQQISVPAAVEVIKAIHRFRRKYPDWCLVDVESASGDMVKIKL